MATVYDLEEAFKNIEDDLVNQVINGIKKTSAESVLKEDNITVWRANQLRELQEFKKRNSKYFTKDRKEELEQQIDEALKEVYKTAGSSQQKKILDAVEKGLKTDPVADDDEILLKFNGVNDRKLNALIKETEKNLYKAQTSAVRYAEDQYRQIIFNSNVYFNTGSGNLVKCIDKATKDFLSAGINNIEYKNGHRVNIQSYAEMALRTAEKRSYIQGEAKMRDNYGLGLVIVNRRGNACPKCMQFVGKIFNDDVYGSAPIDYAYPRLSEAIAGGLYHPNCKDVHTTYFPGITTVYPAPTQEEIEKAEMQYALEQQQRFNERQIRKYKRLADGTLETEEQEKYQNKVRQWQEKQRELIKNNPSLRRKYNRESVIGNVEPSKKVIKNREFEFKELAKTMSESDYKEFQKLISENDYVYRAFNETSDRVSNVVRLKYDKGWYDHDKGELVYNLERNKDNENKFEVLAHEFGHSFDRNGYSFYETDVWFTNDEARIVRKYTNELTPLTRNRISNSDQFLKALDEDIKIIKKIGEDNERVVISQKIDGVVYTKAYKNKDYQYILENRMKTIGIQDFFDGVLGTFNKGGKEYLPAGHGNKYYNRIYKDIKDSNSDLSPLVKELKEIGYEDIGKRQLKEHMRRFETASELFANEFAALTIGGETLEVYEKYAPNTMKLLKEILEYAG